MIIGAGFSGGISMKKTYTKVVVAEPMEEKVFATVKGLEWDEIKISRPGYSIQSEEGECWIEKEVFERYYRNIKDQVESE